MSTNYLAKAKKQQNARPGGLAERARFYAKIALSVFAVGVLVAVGLLALEISTPGMAWYVYE